MQKGVSPTVSFVLSIALLVIFTIATYTWASASIEGLGEEGRIKGYYNQMATLENIMKETARGDENFTSRVYFYHPTHNYVSPYLLVDPDHDRITLTLTQEATVIGKANGSANESCGYDYLLDNTTGITMYRVNEYQTLYQGAAGPGPGEIEFSVCLPNVDIVWGGNCAKGKTGPSTTIVLRKVNITAGKPVLSVDLC